MEIIQSTKYSAIKQYNSFHEHGLLPIDSFLLTVDRRRFVPRRGAKSQNYYLFAAECH